MSLLSTNGVRANLLVICCGVYISAALAFWQSGLYPSFAQGYGNGYGNGYANSISLQQHTALVTFYNQMGGPQWRNSNGWLGDVYSQCSWFGVSCIDGVVNRISLPDNGLTGEIPSSLTELTTLRELNLEKNSISGSLPAGLGNLTDLRSLRLSENNIRGQLPAELNKLRVLRTLSLDKNSFSGSLPDLDSPYLQTLDLSDNEFSGPLSNSYFRLFQLNILKLDNNQIGGSLPATDLSASQLTILSLANNQITGVIPPTLSDLPALEIIYLNENELSGEVPHEILSLPRLKVLQLANNDLSGELIFPKVANGLLESINLSNNNFTGEFPAALFDQKNLERIEMNNNNFSGEIPAQFSDLTGLEVLNLANNNFYGSFPQLSELANLRVLIVGSNRFFPPLPDFLSNGSIELVDASGALNELPSISIDTSQTPVIDSDGKAGEIIKLAGSVTGGDGLVASVRWYTNTDLVSENLLDTVRFNDGIISLKLEVVDDLGQAASKNLTLQINPPVYPTAQISNGLSRYPDTDGQIGELVSISGLGEDLDGSIVSYEWSVDGVKIAEGSDAYLALKNGSATISLTVTDNVGLSATQTLETFIEPPVYAPSKTWPQAFNGTYPDDSFGLSLNNVGIVESDTGIWRTCINVLNADGTRSNEVLDANFTILSIEQGRIQLNDIRPFNPFGSFTDYLEEPDCSGSYDTTTNTYTDYIVYGALMYTVSFKLENLAERIFIISSYLQLDAK